MSRSDRLVKLVASALGLGYLPVAPGTWGSAGAALVYLLLARLQGRLGAGLLAVLWLLALVAGVLVGPRAEELFGDGDPRQFALDEVAGYWLTVLAFQWRGPLATAVAAFVAFRFFDVAKPFPIRRLERLPGGWGVMADDLLAAVYSAATLWIVCHGLLDRFVL